MRLSDLLDVQVLRKLAEANYRASGMPIGIIDAVDGSVLVGFGWQDICTMYHRANPVTVERCRESDDYIKQHLSTHSPCEYTCRNGLRDIGVPIQVGGRHLATLFLGQFFYEGEAPDRGFFLEQARRFGFDERAYLDALDRVPVFSRTSVQDILAYNSALASFISDLAEAALRRREAEQRVESLARFPRENPAPVLRLSRALDVLYANAVARSALTAIGVAVGSPAPEPILDLARRALAEGQPVQGELAAGDRHYAVTVVAGAEDVNVYAHDITSRVHAEEARRRIEQELRDANRAKDDFLGMLSHELRNPLAPIRNALYILDHADPASHQARRAKEVAGRQLTHLSRLVDDLLDVTRIVRGKVEIRPVDLDLTALVRRIGEDHHSVMTARGLRFEVRVPAAPAWTRGDETRLAQVIGNLLDNAAKFTPGGGQVTLSVVPAGGEAVVTVTDTGTGIDAALIGAVFDPFVQAKQSLARSDGGLGLGLALVKGLVELHGGTVAAASGGRGQGATFTVRLPLATAAREATSTARGEPRAGAPLRILVVDDNQDAAESLAELVRMLGHQANVAFDGWSAVRAVKSDPPDLVLCDIGLPGMSGYQVAKALRAEERFDSVQLIAVSGYAQEEDERRSLEAGFAEHIAKPADPAKVIHLLGRSRPGAR